ncbi:hypothetical protein G6F55_007139 [Rhizopus delemar]|uniref:Uncharacterized protein n=2 Tax=Rhizopus TaxID=4842 RepID=A0A9P6Z619_9FUNG|nr:hypothetical protein G6F55_007139 [Rhizopus delemar]KAG1553473.1 hypothetical protein G6F51_000584 [Rhizopus arrhizus]KAG1571079.1 hypothetical protein G6F50_004915 [Rhizopus delemar]
MFSHKYITACSEQSLIVKFWSNIFEIFFGGEKGDTTSAECRNMSLNLKLDIRTVTQLENGEISTFNSEFARPTAITLTKCYEDKMKSVLVGKAHLNSALPTLKTYNAFSCATLRNGEYE